MKYSDQKLIDGLAESLSKLRIVNVHDNDEPECWRIVYGLRDIEEASAKIFGPLSEKLIDSDQEVKAAVLLDIREELRHILYHIKDMKFVSYMDE